MKKRVILLLVFVLAFFIACNDPNKIIIKFDTGCDIQKQNIVYYVGNDLPEMSPPMRDGYKFLNWFLDGEVVTKENLSDKARESSSVTINAKWEVIKYKITYELNGGNTNGPGNPNEYTIEDRVLLGTPTRVNYDFLGWYTNKELSGDPLREISKGTTGDITLYAKWKKKFAFIDLFLYDDNELFMIYPYMQGESVTLPVPSYDKEEKEFLGWFLNLEDETPVDLLTLTADNDKINLYAKWRLLNN